MQRIQVMAKLGLSWTPVMLEHVVFITNWCIGLHEHNLPDDFDIFLEEKTTLRNLRFGRD